MGNLKKCNTCQEIKSVKHFYIQPKGMLGRTGSCKKCRKSYQVKYNQTERGKLLKKLNCQKYPLHKRQERDHRFKEKNPNYWKEYYKQNTEKRLEANRRFFRRHPERKEFYKIYSYALRKGILIRSDSCLMCGIKTKTIGHHYDYTKPLSVTWVCKECHKDIHRKHKFMKKTGKQ